MAYNYDLCTYNSPNPLVRFAHRQRFATALRLVEPTPSDLLLDFGCGDGRFLRNLVDLYNCSDRVFGFEPFLESLSDIPVTIFRDWASVKSRFGLHEYFTIITCFEVLEHLTSEGQLQAFDQIGEILRGDGRLIVSVPIECGLPTLPKNLFRWIKSPPSKNHIYNWKNIFRSLFGIPIPECRSGENPLTHMGFYYKDLESNLKMRFRIVDRVHSPFPALGANFNSQIFYVLRQR